ncbi:hypothetical protein F5882DRAFT_408657 [Hyaloscypha sp. PMI_1271]|nr:hypothetical protein F5882DRAFT_408657 [Hyaloscypha sp. PMI_1271]
MREAVMAGDLGLVQRLICYEVDPNDGPCFMERPFQTAIMIGNLEIARYLIWRCNIADLGNLWAPLCLALRKGVLEEAQAILNMPRTLTSHDINGTSTTMMQALRENLRTEHNSFLAASMDTKASVGFQNLGDQLQDYRTLWKMGISAMRRLRKDRAPSDFRQVISLLLVASAMRKTCSVEEFGDYDAFLLDLRRWRRLAVEESRRGVFDELVFCLWGQEIHPIEGNVDDFGKDINFLRAFTSEFAEMTNSSSTTDSAVFDEIPGDEQDGDSPSNGASEHHRPEAQRSDEDPVPIPETQKTSLSCTIAAFLRIGAIFCFFITCLLVFQGFFMQENILHSPGLFSSSIDAAYVAPMQLESPFWCSFPSFVEEARSRIRAGSIRTVAGLDDFMYYKALSSMPLGQVWDESSMRKVIEIGSVSLKKALKHWTTQKSLTYMTVYHGLQPTVASVTSCIDDNPNSSIATDLRELSYSLRKINISPIGVISTPVSLQTSQTSTSTSTTPLTSGSMTQHKSPVQTSADSETAFSPPQAWSPVSSSYVPQSTLPMSQEPSPHLRAISIPRPRKHANRIRKQPPPEGRTCKLCGLVLSSVGNKNRHVGDKHPPVNGSGGGDGLSQESSPVTGSPSGMLARKLHFCKFRCGARYTQARNRDDHEKKQCRNRDASYGVGQG